MPPIAQPLPLISIILPTHNCASFIAESIESVLAQSYTHWELIICDDGSTDDTAAVVHSYLDDPRIHYHPLEKQPSVYRVRNIGFSRTSGDMIAFLDADDTYTPDALEQMVQALKNNPGAQWAYGFYTCMNEKGEPIPNQGVNLATDAQGRLAIPATSTPTWRNILDGRCVSVLQTILIRRPFMEAVGPFYDKATHAFDIQYLYRLFLQDMDAALAVPAYVVRYRIHPKGITKNPKLIQDLIDSRLALAHWIYSVPDMPKDLAELKSYYYLLTYLRLARLQLFEARPRLVFTVAKMAFKDVNVRKKDALIQFLPLLILAFVPTGLYRRIFNTAKQAVNFYGQLATRFTRPPLSMATGNA